MFYTGDTQARVIRLFGVLQTCNIYYNNSVIELKSSCNTKILYNICSI